jgi:predicted hotdog family 3-hydroxylacyl-ACP dehydratase
MLDRAAIERRVPHAGAMCLLDAVLQWDTTTIHCSAAAPTAAHPLAREGRLPAIAAVEYAAQAAAVHGALLDGQAAAREGLLAKLAEIEFGMPMADEAGGALDVQAELLSRVASGCMYRFAVRNARAEIVRGRLMVAFAA